jgi:hypothetical protein
MRIGISLANIGIALILSCFAVMIAIGQDGEEAAKESGIVTYVQGSVKKKPPTSDEWLRAQENTEVYGGEKVRTYDESRAEMELKQLDVVRLAPNTTIDIVKLYEETKQQRDETQIDVEEGDLWALVGQVSADASFQINSPVTGSAITGTKFRIGVSPDSSTQLKVYSGEVKITNAPSATGLIPQPLPKVAPTQGQAPGSMKGPTSVQGPTSVEGPKSVTLEEWVYIVKNMQQIKVDSRGQVLSAGEFTAEDPEEQSEWVKWNMAMDKRRGR